ncbi:MAG: T9SS type A sorting domain-containing protein, partial [Candidatus Marinimicrobia bacterium]|nr:T9SS type A sorting domain-containing protein [Candidatus Neomarinimicrobiota bacterium]
DLTYNPNQVTVEGIDWSDQIDHFMIEENNEPGSIKVAGSGTTPDGQEGVFATIRLQVLETTTEESINLTINKIRINESAPVEDVMVFITQEVLSTDNATVPNVYALHQNYPNPFNPNTKISYDLPEASVVSLSIYDLMGREIRTMINSEQIAGFKNIQWNATDNLGKSVPAGMYIYTIQAGEFRQTRKMVLLK